MTYPYIIFKELMKIIRQDDKHYLVGKKSEVNAVLPKSAAGHVNLTSQDVSKIELAIMHIQEAERLLNAITHKSSMLLKSYSACSSIVIDLQSVSDFS